MQAAIRSQILRPYSYLRPWLCQFDRTLKKVKKLVNGTLRVRWVSFETIRWYLCNRWTRAVLLVKNTSRHKLNPSHGGNSDLTRRLGLCLVCYLFWPALSCLDFLYICLHLIISATPLFSAGTSFLPASVNYLPLLHSSHVFANRLEVCVESTCLLLITRLKVPFLRTTTRVALETYIVQKHSESCLSESWADFFKLKTNHWTYFCLKGSWIH